MVQGGFKDILFFHGRIQIAPIAGHIPAVFAGDGPSGVLPPGKIVKQRVCFRHRLKVVIQVQGDVTGAAGLQKRLKGAGTAQLAFRRNRRGKPLPDAAFIPAGVFDRQLFHAFFFQSLKDFACLPEGGQRNDLLIGDAQQAAGACHRPRQLQVSLVGRRFRPSGKPVFFNQILAIDLRHLRISHGL